MIGHSWHQKILLMILENAADWDGTISTSFNHASQPFLL